MDGKKGTILLAGAAVLLALTIWQGWTLREQGEQLSLIHISFLQNDGGL